MDNYDVDGKSSESGQLSEENGMVKYVNMKDLTSI